MSDADDTPALDSFMDEVAKLRRAAELLEELWMALGPHFRFQEVADSPYGDQEEVWKAWGKVQDHFGFDDSE